jgi:hypothetical protein
MVFSLCVFFALFLSLSLYVLPARASSEPSLPILLSNLGFTNIAALPVETFPPGTYNITMYAEFTPYFSSNELSVYPVGTGNFTPILEGSEGVEGYVSPLTKSFTVDYQFGFSLSGIGALPFRYFTESSQNPSGQQYAIIYRNLDVPGMLLIGFDDRAYCSGLGDYDYNDMVFSLQLQYYLQVVSPYDTPSGGGWYGNGTTAFASLTGGIVDHGNGTRRVFTQWSGDASGTNYLKSDPILMIQNKAAVATWKTQYYLTVGTIPSGLAVIPGQEWYDQNQNVTLTAPTVSGYNFNYWDVDGFPQANGLNPLTVSMNGPHTATAHYARPFTLTITVTSGGTTNPSPGAHVFNENSTVQVTATPNTNYVLDHWELDGANAGSANPYTVLMNANHTLLAAFTFSSALQVTISPMSASIYKGQSVSFSSNVTGGIPPYNYQWYLDGSPVSGATSNSWTATFAQTGVYHVFLKVTDSKGNMAQSGAARISVASPSTVGGFSISLKRDEPIQPFMLYLTFFAATAVAITAIRRKRTRSTK